MENIVKKYLLQFDELNALISFRIRKLSEESPEKKAEIIIQDLLSLLIIAYQDGVISASSLLKANLKPDTGKMHSAIFAQIDGKNFQDRVREHVANGHDGKLLDLAESEFHRVFNTGMYDSAESVGAEITKTWRTVGDEKVRDTHSYLENMTIPIDEKFYTYDGDSARFPGDFENAGNNANCRCILEYARQRSL